MLSRKIKNETFEDTVLISTSSTWIYKCLLFTTLSLALLLPGVLVSLGVFELNASDRTAVQILIVIGLIIGCVTLLLSYQLQKVRKGPEGLEVRRFGVGKFNSIPIDSIFSLTVFITRRRWLRSNCSMVDPFGSSRYERD